MMVGGWGVVHALHSPDAHTCLAHQQPHPPQTIRGDVTLECPGAEPVTIRSVLLDGGEHVAKPIEPEVLLNRTESGFLVSAFA